uniref:Lysosomal trafficking regulator lyst n=1 Tax=Mesocestoides corti TaxID=53468 RepID=A0A5K3F5J3_MESCO
MLNEILAIEKDLWSGVCGDIFSFTASSPSFFLPGVLLLLDLLPLPLPIKTLRTLSVCDRKAMTASRDWWCRHLSCLSVEVCGLVELLSPSPPGGPLHSALRRFVDRVTNLGSTNIALMLANSALDTCLEVCAGNTSKSPVASSPSRDLSGEQQQTGAKDDSTCKDQTGDGASTTELSLPPNIQTLTVGSTLVLGAQTSLCLQGQPSTSACATTNEDQFTKIQFCTVGDPSEIMHSLSLLCFILQHPVCKQAFLDILYKDSLQAGGRVNSEQTPTRGQRLLVVFTSILEAYTDSRSHVEVQTKLIDCIDCLLDPSIGMEEPDSTHRQSHSTFDFANHLPPIGWLMDIVAGILAHLDHPERDLVSVPPVLRVLYRLSMSDFGFSIVQRQLSIKKYERVFANVLQRVNDSFSAENPDCRATLSFFLLLVSALLGDPIFAEEANLAIGEETLISPSPTTSGYLSERELRLSTLRLKQLLCWTEKCGEKRTGNPIEDLTSCLDILANEQSSLRPLREGMKSLLHLLAGVEDICDQTHDDFDSQPIPPPSLPEPVGFTKLFALSACSETCSVNQSDDLATSRSALKSMLLLPSLKFEKKHHLGLKTLNLSEYAAEICPGIDLKLELATSAAFGPRKRHNYDIEATIQHQRRRRGQASAIIQTGRSAKKYVAPMRGRGFTIRQTAPSAGSGSSLLGPGLLGVGAGAGSAGGRADIFRSRPQNTSRPPSLHVDDFNKLEKGEAESHEPSYGRDGGIRTLRDGSAAAARGGRGGAIAGTGSGGRVLSSLPFVGATPTSSILPTPVGASPANLLQSWAAGARSLNLLPLTNPTASGRPSSGSLFPPTS